MVRHSGFVTSFLAILLAALAVSLLERRTDGSPELRGDTRAWNTTTFSRFDPFSKNAYSAGTQGDIETASNTSTVRFTVPRNSLIIVGSLDISGAVHSLIIRSDSEEHCNNVVNHVAQQELGLQYLQSVEVASMLRTSREPSSARILGTKANRPGRTCESKCLPSPLVLATRRFLIPHFEHDQIIQHPCEASVIAEGARVRVYVDHSLIRNNCDPGQSQRLRNAAKTACATIEEDLLPDVENWIGRITDLDDDHRLSVVLTDLDRRKSAGDTPVLGCVRRRDFLTCNENSMAGDIIYLDQHLPPHEQLLALLAHELTHAAVYCIPHEAAENSPLKNHLVPSWLNEAAAHWVERQFCSAPAGYEIRESAFRQCPALCPVVVVDEQHSLTSRRTGSRVAGFTFLRQYIDDANTLRQVLHQCTAFDETMSTTMKAPFSDLFRQWTIRQTCFDDDSLSTQQLQVEHATLKDSSSGPIRRKLYGTAFLVLKCETQQEVSIDVHHDAQLQITVVHHETPHSTQHWPRFSTAESDRITQLEPLMPQAIR